MNWTTLVSAEELAAALHDPSLRIVDARFVLAGGDAEAGERAWRAAHLPGAGYVHLNRDLSDLRKPASEGRHPLPDAAAFCATLERLGISPDSQVVVYDAADGAMAAARFWWLLRLLGHERVAVLDGGFARWTALGVACRCERFQIFARHLSRQLRHQHDRQHRGSCTPVQLERRLPDRCPRAGAFSRRSGTARSGGRTHSGRIESAVFRKSCGWPHARAGSVARRILGVDRRDRAARRRAELRLGRHRLP